MSLQLEKRVKELETQIHSLAGETFNINSNQQLGRILFEKLKIHEEIGKQIIEQFTRA